MSSLLSPLFGILNWITCLFMSFFYLVADGIMWAINMGIAGIGLALAAILLLLPNMPSLPSLPSLGSGGVTFATVEGWVAWFWPVSTSVAILAFILTAWLIWLGVSILLRWAKAIGS